MSPWGEEIVFGRFDDRFNLLEAGVGITVCLLVVHAAVADVEDPGALGHDHLQYSTVQYSTVQYSTVQYSLYRVPMSLSLVSWSPAACCADSGGRCAAATSPSCSRQSCRSRRGRSAPPPTASA